MVINNNLKCYRKLCVIICIGEERVRGIREMEDILGH